MRFRIGGFVLGMIVLMTSTVVYSQGIKFGVGVSATQSGDTIYIPIKIPINKKFILIEPMISNFSKNETDNLSTFSGNQKTKETDYGSGVYLLVPVSQNCDLQFGFRGAYLKYDDTGIAYNNNTSVTAVTEKRHGYLIAPVLGWNYNFNEHITIGVAVDYAYTKINIEYNDYTGKNPSYDGKIEHYATNTDLFIKYYF